MTSNGGERLKWENAIIQGLTFHDSVSFEGFHFTERPEQLDLTGLVGELFQIGFSKA